MDMKERYFTAPLRILNKDEKVYALKESEINAILNLRGLKTELDPGMGGVSPRVIEDLLNDASELVSLDIALTSACNFKCIWCYRPDEEWGKDRIPFDRVVEIIEQASRLGVRFFVLTGGEPLMYRDQDKTYFDVVDKIYEIYQSQNLPVKVLTFTDVALIDAQKARMLAERKIGLCLKKDSLDREIQDGILGVEGFVKMEQGYQNLFDAGYGSNPDLPVSVNTVLAKSIVVKDKGVINTLDGCIDLHRWVKSHNMEHSIVPIHYCGEAIDETQEEGIHPLEVKALYDILAEIDAREYQDPWQVYSPFPKNKTCNRPGRGVHVRATGKVTSCSESPLIDAYVFGNAKKDNLIEMIRSELYQSFKKDFAVREGTYICNPDACDLNKNYLCRGGCATRSAYTKIDAQTGSMLQNTDMLAYSKGREDPLCPGWIVLAQKQGVLKEGVYEQMLEKLLNLSSLDSAIAIDIKEKLVRDFNAIKNTLKDDKHDQAKDTIGRTPTTV
jgi:radical SAM protein with 4Fe4S-binding SPASM domain